MCHWQSCRPHDHTLENTGSNSLEKGMSTDEDRSSSYTVFLLTVFMCRLSLADPRQAIYSYTPICRYPLSGQFRMESGPDFGFAWILKYFFKNLCIFVHVLYCVYGTEVAAYLCRTSFPRCMSGRNSSGVAFLCPEMCI